MDFSTLMLGALSIVGFGVAIYIQRKPIKWTRLWVGGRDRGPNSYMIYRAITIEKTPYLFTTEQCEVAEQRALNLKWKE